MDRKTRETLRSFSIELVIYAALVAGYFFLVLHFLGGWLKLLFDAHRAWFAVVSLLLIIGQGVLLEAVTTGLLAFIRRRRF